MFSAPRTCVPSSLLIGELIHGRGPAQQTGTTSLVAGTVLGLRTRQIDVACSRPDLQRRWVHYRAPRADQSSLNPRSAPWSRTAPWSQAAAGSGSTGELMDAIRPQILRQREMPEPAAPGAVADASVSRDMTQQKLVAVQVLADWRATMCSLDISPAGLTAHRIDPPVVLTLTDSQVPEFHRAD